MSSNTALINGGYVLQPRAIEYSGVMEFPPVTREMWFYICRKVQHKDYKGLKRGEGFFRFAEIQEALSWYIGYRKMKYSKPQLTKSLRRLREGNNVETVRATHGIIIRVCNYAHWQNADNYESNGEEPDEGTTKETEGLQYKQECNKNVKNVKRKFVPPTSKEVTEYAKKIGYSLDPDKFINAYEQKDWMVGKNKMKSWKAAIRNWKANKWGMIGNRSSTNYTEKEESDLAESERIFKQPLLKEG